ncbi:MAG: AAA family ATPase [Verrucomicrobia bacterium]|nr:AAA family ATPase [Verrucomicrobiota bacterium]
MTANQKPAPCQATGKTNLGTDYVCHPHASSGLESKERAVIATLLTEFPSGPMPDTLAKLLRHASESFDDLRFATIAVAIRELSLAGKPVHVLTVREWLDTHGKLDAAGGAMFLDALARDAIPLTLAEIEANDVWSAYSRRRLKSVLADALESTERQPEQAPVIADGVITALSDLARNGEALPWLPLVEDGADIVTEQLPAVVEIVEGIVAEQCKLVIGSGSKSFKTWLTLDLGLSISHGALFLGRKTHRQRVLYINLELRPQAFKRRVQAVAKAKGIVVDRDWFRHLPLRGKLAGLTVHAIVNRIVALAKRFSSRVVILDPVYKLNVEGDENSSRDQTRLFNQLDRITTEAECTLVLNDHFGKGNQSEKDPLDAIRGSSAKGGDVDAAMILRKHEVEGCYRVDVIHRELAPVEPFVIGWKFPSMELRPDLDPDSMKKVKAGRRKAHDPRELLTVIVENTAENPVTISAWAEAAGIKRQTLTEYLPGMRSRGWVATTGEGKSARQFCTEKGREIARKRLEDK